MQRRNQIIFLVAVVFGLAAVWLANTYFGALEQRNADLAALPKGTIKVLAAKQPVAYGDTITAENAGLVDWPAGSVPQGAVTEAQAQAFIAKQNTAKRALVAGEPILLSPTSAGGLSASIPVDQRAVSIPLDAVTGVSGFISPGDYVDVVLTRAIPGSDATADQQMATMVLQNVPVLAIDARNTPKPVQAPEGPDGKPIKLPDNKTATLMVDAIGAQKIALATQVGKLTLVLRNAADRTPTIAATVLPRDLGGAGVRVARTEAQPTAAAPRRAAARPRPVQTALPPLAPYRPTMTVVRGTQESVEGVISNGY